MAPEKRYLARRYRPYPQKQRTTYNGKLIGCTETSFATGVDAVTCGGVLVTERMVRAMSSEPNPNPSSPGLNLDQLDDVARGLHVLFTNRTGAGPGSVLSDLRAGAKLVLQLWYPAIGGPAIGHAIMAEGAREKANGHWEVLAVDPMKGEHTWFAWSRVRDGMVEFGRRTNVPNGGVRYGSFDRKPPKIALGAS